ncbi:polysaccharide ABC transporter ATP-binding protein [Gloeocapsa sp. PCC 73106]|uniref:ABC transporter ATP-binding protein n=1 Tax=Gloeocapsa sp. PCC 73106 TaxID=102232 RepID=UPI0002AC8667|nr:polysaccharide ABC transporter ATP-binding protein [Gloeocapsa sp. PCC 73106]ELR97720.1 ABC-type polysaccharide/polyol phosphate transport system, ATPase component [Gloeocapsa sp. PCC 73106]
MTISNQPVISVVELSKKYYLGSENYQVTERILRRFKRKTTDSIIWALKNVSFEIYKGEKVGIIGKNGAGKSTLLKILSRLVYPTTGRAIIRGRITSLLEVGTGFNSNLSGRDNIYLNASLHGLQNWEIEAIFEDIVEFSEVRQFLDTPVKHYSSGMRMRLAFAVAAHLDPDILLLDEVLAVGDMSFQQKCLKRVEGLTSEGRTVIFVSHSMDAIARFCDRCLWLDRGEIIADGPTEAVISQYVEKVMGVTPQWSSRPDSPSKLPTSPYFQVISAKVINSEGEGVTTVPVYQKVGIEIVYDIFDNSKNIQPALHFKNDKNQFAFAVAYTDPDYMYGPPHPGRYRVIAWIPPNLFNIGLMHVTIVMLTPDPLTEYLVLERAVSFNVHETQGVTDTARGVFARDFPGVVRPMLAWDTKTFSSVESLHN